LYREEVKQIPLPESTEVGESHEMCIARVVPTNHGNPNLRPVSETLSSKTARIAAGCRKSGSRHPQYPSLDLALAPRLRSRNFTLSRLALPACLVVKNGTSEGDYECAGKMESYGVPSENSIRPELA
jgi:hypothetical protein